MLTPVTAAIILHGKRVLIARRAWTSKRGGLWEFPGGKIEYGETPVEALSREIREELGLEIRVGRHFFDSTFEYDDIHIELMCYLAEIVRGKPLLAVHSKVRWAGARSLARVRLAPADIAVAQKVISELLRS